MATDCIAKVTFGFEPKGKPIVARFDVPHASSDGGAVLLKSLDTQLQLNKRVAACLIDGRLLELRPHVAHCHFGLAKLYRRTGKREQAQEHLATATVMYREMDMPFYLEQAETELASDRPIVGQTDGP
jgi:hypothetical protein